MPVEPSGKIPSIPLIRREEKVSLNQKKKQKQQKKEKERRVDIRV
mgnify:CR=1 FL=1